MSTDGGGWTLVMTVNGGDANSFSSMFNVPQNMGIWEDSTTLGSLASWKTADYKSEAYSRLAGSELLIANSADGGATVKNVLETTGNCLQSKNMATLFQGLTWNAIGSDVDWSTNGTAYLCNYSNFGFSDTLFTANSYSKIGFKWGEADGQQDGNKDRTAITVGNATVSLSANVDAPRGLGGFTNRTSDGITYKDVNACNGDAPSDCAATAQAYYLFVR